jgi:hypothetical protein
VCGGVVFSGIFSLYLLLNIKKRISPTSFEKKILTSNATLGSNDKINIASTYLLRA